MRLRGSLLFIGALMAAMGMAACGGGGGIAKSTTPGVSGVHSAYTANMTDGSISEYAIDTSGVLHEITGSPIKLTGGNPAALVMSNDGKFLYAADPAKNQIFSFSIDANSGVLTSIGTTASGTTPNSMAIEPGNKFLYVGNLGASTISVYAIGSDGKLTETAFSPVAVNGGVNSVTVSSKGTYLFAAVPSSGDIYEFTVNASTGNLTAAAGTPYAIGSAPAFVAVSPDETFAIVGDQNSTLNRLNIASGGALTLAANSPFVAGSVPIQAVIDSTSTYIYILNYNSQNVAVLQYVNGVPQRVASVGTQRQPYAMALYNKNLYLTNGLDNTVAEYVSATTTTTTNSVTTTTFSLTPLSPAAQYTGKKPQGIAVR